MLANRLKQCRTARGLTVKQLAAQAGIARNTIYDIERGRSRATLRWPTMRALAAGLELPVSSVFPDAKANV